MWTSSNRRAPAWTPSRRRRRPAGDDATAVLLLVLVLLLLLLMLLRRLLLSLVLTVSVAFRRVGWRRFIGAGAGAFVFV